MEQIASISHLGSVPSTMADYDGPIGWECKQLLSYREILYMYEMTTSTKEHSCWIPWTTVDTR